MIEFSLEQKKEIETLLNTSMSNYDIAKKLNVNLADLQEEIRENGGHFKYKAVKSILSEKKKIKRSPVRKGIYTPETRRLIQFYLSKRYTQRKICEFLNIGRSSLSREIILNGGMNNYSAENAINNPNQKYKKYYGRKKSPSLFEEEQEDKEDEIVPTPLPTLLEDKENNELKELKSKLSILLEHMEIIMEILKEMNK